MTLDIDRLLIEKPQIGVTRIVLPGSANLQTHFIDLATSTLRDAGYTIVNQRSRQINNAGGVCHFSVARLNPSSVLGSLAYDEDSRLFTGVSPLGASAAESLFYARENLQTLGANVVDYSVDGNRYSIQVENVSPNTVAIILGAE